ncbi:hypothetical protein, partial [Priestia megaterium]
MEFKTQTIYQTDANGFETLRKEVVDRQKVRDARMTAISNGLEKATPVTLDVTKMDVAALIRDVKKEAKNNFNTQHGLELRNASKQVLNALIKELDNVKTGLHFAKMSRLPNK